MSYLNLNSLLPFLALWFDLFNWLLFLFLLWLFFFFFSHIHAFELFEITEINLFLFGLWLLVDALLLEISNSLLFSHFFSISHLLHHLIFVVTTTAVTFGVLGISSLSSRTIDFSLVASGHFNSIIIFIFKKFLTINF